MKIGFIGLGKMGSLIAQNLKREHDIFGYDIDLKKVDSLNERGVTSFNKLDVLVERVGDNGVFWIMVNHEFVDDVIQELSSRLTDGAIVVEGGNSNYYESQQRKELLDKQKISYACVGMSGGVYGAATQPPMMVDGSQAVYNTIIPLLETLGGNYCYLPQKAHLSKIIHNAIEYGMMQSLADGVALYLGHGFTQKQIQDIFNVWSRGSIIESKLVNLLCEILDEHHINKSVEISKSETLDLIKSALIEGVKAPVIEKSVQLRESPGSQDRNTLTILALLRNKFGGHEVKNNE